MKERKGLSEKVKFLCGIEAKNRFVLAPMTNCQSNEDGTLSDEELHWLSLRAKGGFAIIMTCACHVQANGQGFAGQLAMYDKKHIEGHKLLTKTIKSEGALAVIQLFHGGMRADSTLIEGPLVSASKNEEYGAVGLTGFEVQDLKNSFVEASIMAQEAGYDGVQLHGAHGYILCQFLSAEINYRNDQYGGSLQNRARLLFEILDGVRDACGKNFLISVRLSPERFGMNLSEVVSVSQDLIDSGNVDLLDISLWDYKKTYLQDHNTDGKTLLQYFEDLNLRNVILTVAGKIRTRKDVYEVLQSSVDMVSIGRSAILHHNFPELVMRDKHFVGISTPVSPEYLVNEGLSEKFIDYMRRWKGFVT